MVAHCAQITLSFSGAALSIALTERRASLWWPLHVDSMLIPAQQGKLDMFLFCCWGWCHLMIPCSTFPMSSGTLLAALWLLQSTRFPWTPEGPTSIPPLDIPAPLPGLSALCSLPAAASMEGLPLFIFVLLFRSTPVPHSPCPFQKELEKPGDTRCLPLSGFWDNRIIHLRKLQLGTVSGKRPD